MSDLKEKARSNLEREGDDSHRSRSNVASVALACAVVAALFSFAVATVMLADYYRLATVKPLTLPALRELNQRLSESPDDAKLKREIRDLDLAARTAYFDTVSSFRAGAVLFALGAVIALLSTHIHLSTRVRSIRPPKRPSTEDPLVSAAKSRYYLILGSLWSLAAFAVVFFIFGRAVTGVTDNSLSPSSKIAADEHREAISNVPLATLEFSADVFKDNCPEFRGYRGSATVAAAERAYPKKWNGAAGEGVAWKLKLPSAGFSTPVFWNGKLFMTGGDEKRREVFCVDSTIGRVLWRKAIPFMAPAGTKLPKVTNDTGYAAPTMTTDGTRVFAIFATGDIAALTMDGEFVWKKSLGVPVNHYGFASSLVFVEGELIVQLYNSEDPRLLALNPATGEVLWTNRSAKEISWSSPISAKLAGREVLLVQSSVALLAVSASDGRTIWRTECLAGEVAPSPAIVAGRVLAANDNASALALDAATGKLLWQNEDVDLPDVASVLATEKGRVYLAASFGPLTCLDAKTGKVLWVHEFDTGFYSSPILVDGLIYLLDMKGRMSIIEDAPKFKLVSTCELGESCVCTPIFIDGTIYIRALKHLYKLDGT